MSKDTTRNTQTLTYVVMVVLTQNHLARVYTPTHVENVERNGHIKKALAQHKDACIEKCGKPNHFVKMCRTKLGHPKGQQNKSQVVNGEENESSCNDGDYLYSTGSDKSKFSTVLVKINNVKTRVIIDTGTFTDIINEIAFAHINQKNNITLQPSSKCLLAYGSTNQLAVRGQFQSTISFQN